MSKTPVLQVKDLAVSVEGKQILRGVTLTLHSGEIHALMGPNGSGKSSLAMTLLGHSHYIHSDTSSHALLVGHDLLTLSPDERARIGLFVAWQTPLSIPGVSVFTLCRTAYEAHGNTITSIVDFRHQIETLLERVGLTREYIGRGVNEGFSGGEKKRLELLQLLLLRPRVAILDEIDSGLDVDALRLVSEVVREVTESGTAVLLITHYKRLLDFAHPDTVHVLKNGLIEKTGGSELVAEIDTKGYRT